MHIEIISPAKIKDSSNLGSILVDYLKRLNVLKVNIIDFEDKNLSLDKTNSKIFSLVKPGFYTIMLDERGKNPTTMEFKNLLASIDNKKGIAFLIGSADGFTEEDRNNVNFIMSLSNFTFPHQFARLLLVEQLYRVETLMLNHPYHRS